MIENPLVSIICTTYNHEQYIRQALESFLAQKCNFSFEIVIHDDASTDRTADIIREYRDKTPSIFNAILQTENQYSQGNDVTDLLYNQKSRGKYIALCEGDDYWTDPLKLQKQVDFLEEHQEYIASYSKIQRYYQKKGVLKEIFGQEYVSFERLLKVNVIPTPTVLFRKSMYVNYYNEVNPMAKNWKMGDYPLWLWFAANGKLCFIDQVMAVYRVLENSASHFDTKIKQREFQENSQRIALYFSERYKILENESMTQLLWINLEICALSDDRKKISQLEEQIKHLKAQYHSMKLTTLSVGIKCPWLFLRFLSLFRIMKTIMGKERC